MEIGPFTPGDVEALKALFEAKKIKFSITVDREAEQGLLSDFNRRATTAPRATAGHLDLQIVYFEISDSDFEKVAENLEKYGIKPSTSDGSYELGDS